MAPSQGQGGVAGMNASRQASPFTAFHAQKHPKYWGTMYIALAKFLPLKQRISFSAEPMAAGFTVPFPAEPPGRCDFTGRLSLYTRVKKTVENQADCSAWIKGNPTVTEIQQRLRESG